MKEDTTIEIKITKAIDVVNEVKNLPEPIFIWKGIPECSKGLLTGVAKTGKTTFAENLALSLSVGKKEFFKFPMDGKPRRVLFVNLEEKARIWGKRQNKQLQVLSKDELELYKKNYFVLPDGQIDFINNDDDWLKLNSYIKKINPEVLIIDSLSHLLVGEIEKSLKSQEFVQQFRKYIGIFNITTIVIHHNTKGNNRPVEMDSIAGSRFITQEFEFAYAFANVPGSESESYVSMVYNKYVPRESSTSYTYSFDDFGWVQNTGKVDKYKLYSGNSTDFRFGSDNKEKIYNYIFSKCSTSSQSDPDNLDENTNLTIDVITATASELKKNFCDSGTMSNDTLFNNLKRLIEEKKIIKESTGKYRIC